MVEEGGRTALDRMLASFTKNNNYQQVHITEYQPNFAAQSSNLYVNEDLLDYEAGSTAYGNIIDPVSGERIPIEAHILEDEELVEKRGLDDGRFVESILEDGRGLQHLHKETVVTNFYPENISNPEKSVGGSDFIDDIFYN